LETAAFVQRLGGSVDIIGVDSSGTVDPVDVAAAVDEDTAVVSVMLANNETGVLQDIRRIVGQVKDRPGDTVVHTDAVQAFISNDMSVDDLGVDLLSLAAHKFGGPKGIGVLYVRDGVALAPVLHGGGQELGRRSGTHNVMGAVGMAEAAVIASSRRREFRASVGEMRDRFEALLRSAIPDVTIQGSSCARLVQHSHVRFPGIRNETMLVRLDQAGVAAASGSSCQSGAASVSHVLTAMGWAESEAREVVRFSFGWSNTPGDVQAAADAVIAAHQRLSKAS
jgi:cysteine desulfurase